MRRDTTLGRAPRVRAYGGLALLGILGAVVPARAQEPAPAPVPQPFYPTVEQRSGLLGRFVPINPPLPHDPWRDTFYDTRFTTCPDKNINHPNWFRTGGLYGRRWPGYCTESYYPYFFGSAGSSTIGPGCKPWPRYLKYAQTFFHPFHPVCYYYDEGSYVPIYDLDPFGPGPGRVPNWFPWYLKNPHGG